MPKSIYEEANREFSTALSLVRGNLTFLTGALTLRPRMGGMINWQSHDQGAVAEARAFMNFKDVDELYLYSGFVVIIAASFERFVRRLISDAVRHHNSRLKRYEDIAVSILHQNWYRSGQVLSKIFEPPDECEIDFDELSRNLGTTAKGASSPRLNAEAFSLFLSNFTPDRVYESMRRIGVELNWDDIGRIPAMQAAAGKTQTKETTKAVKDTLKEFIRARNRIAHGGNLAASITRDDIINYLNFFDAFATALASVVETEFKKVK